MDHPYLAPILKNLPNDVEFKGEEGGVVLNLQDNGQDLTFSAVELVAMVLSSAQVKINAIKFYTVLAGSSCCRRSKGRVGSLERRLYVAVNLIGVRRHVRAGPRRAAGG